MKCDNKCVVSEWHAVLGHILIMFAGMEWKPLSVDRCCIQDGHTPNSPYKVASLVTDISSMCVTEPLSPLTSTLFDSDGDKEPIDIDRNMHDVTLVEVRWMLLSYLSGNSSELKSQRITAWCWQHVAGSQL
jgi:hypothetical protein